MNHEELLRQIMLAEQELQGAEVTLDTMRSLADEFNSWAGKYVDMHNTTAQTTPTQTKTVEPIPEPPAPKQYTVEATNTAVLDKDYERLVRMTQVFSKFATMLTMRNIKVGIHTDNFTAPDAPAWSDSDSITFNRAKISKLDTPKAVTALKGLSLHEICHILMTPRDGTVLVKNVRTDKLWPSFNALEDMRIEMFMSTRYSNVSTWLTATIAQFLLDEPKQIPYQFPLVYGRKYLPVEMRKMARDAYTNPADIPEFEQLIDEYIVMNLSDPANYKRAHEIIKRYDELIANIQPEDGRGNGWERIQDANGHRERKVAEWKPVNGKALNKAQQGAIAVRIKTDNGTSYGDPIDIPAGTTDKADSSGTDPVDSNTNPTDGPSGQSAGAGNATAVYKDILEDVLETIYDTKREEIADAIRQFNGEAALTGNNVPVPKRPDWLRMEPVEPSAVQSSRSFGKELEQLRGDHDPSWDRRVEAGRLNVQRYVAGCDVEEAFDVWELGREDAVDIECAVLLDVSGSMQWALKHAYQSMWAIKRALDKINASTTVVTFGDRAELLYSSTERAGITMKYAGTGGGTEPKDAIKYAHSIMADSKRAIKLVIAITDGEWYDGNASDNMLRQLRKAGVLTALAYVANPEYIKDNSVVKINSHGCEVAANITDSRDLFNLARKLVKVGVARNLA